MLNVTSENVEGRRVSVDITSKPDRCPICHNGTDAPLICAFHKGELFEGRLQVVFRCTIHSCLGYFVATYRPDPYDRFRPTKGPYFLSQLAPITPEPEKFSEMVCELSPNFCEIQQQSSVAEALGLDKVCGVGYRKALEFLIKDYAIEREPAKSEEIKNTFLGKCIDKHVDDVRIKDCASRATWLGNDEAHYVKIWVDKDLEDLKTLIKLTVNWIESVKLTEQYKRKM